MNSDDASNNFHDTLTTDQPLQPAAIPHKAALSFTSLCKLPNMLYSDERFFSYLQIYLCTAIFANLGLLFWDGNGGDIGFWEDWIKQLSTKGYKDFNGNYPPIYIHWLYVLGQIYNYLELPVENNIFLKFLTQIPIMILHLVLIMTVYKLLKNYSSNTSHFHLAMTLTALNPAIFFNGSIWGQVDILPVVPVILAILSSTYARYRLLTFPLYTIAILTKFQMIAFAPVMGIIFFRHYKIHLLGFIASFLVIFLAFLPSTIAGSFIQAFKLAYIDVLHQYGATTMGAANIWILLTGNAAPDHLLLFGVSPESPLAGIFKAKSFGIICFFLVCLCVFIQGMGKLVSFQLSPKNPSNTAQLFFYGMICTAAFFTLLPAMHERYLLPAVIVSLAYYAVHPKGMIYPLVFTFISAFNLGMCLGLKTSSVWPAISWIMFAAFCYALLDLMLGKYWLRSMEKIFVFVTHLKYLTLLVLLLSLSYMGNRLYNETRLHKPELADNQIFLTQLPIDFSHQDYGHLNINKSVNGNKLQTNNRRYAVGLGSHANSTIEYQLPPDAIQLNILAGLDDEVESASAQFYIWGDNRLLWESKIHYGAEAPEAAEVNLTGISRLRLQIVGVNGIGGDHANWLSPVLTLREKMNP